jgi:hypothetical protein
VPALSPGAAGTGANGPQRPASPAHIIRSDAEAIAIARDLASKFVTDSSLRDRERRLPWAELDLFSQSGLWAMNVPACSMVTAWAMR